MDPLEKNKAIFLQFTDDIVNHGRFAVADELLAPSFVYHRTDGPLEGIESMKGLFRMVREGMPDVRGDVEQIVAEGDKVAIRVKASGTHAGMMFGIPATNKRAEWIEMHIARIVDGKITDIWGMMDMMGLFQQLGIM